MWASCWMIRFCSDMKASADTSITGVCTSTSTSYRQDTTLTSSALGTAGSAGGFGTWFRLNRTNRLPQSRPWYSLGWTLFPLQGYIIRWSALCWWCWTLYVIDTVELPEPTQVFRLSDLAEKLSLDIPEVAKQYIQGAFLCLHHILASAIVASRTPSEIKRCKYSNVRCNAGEVSNC